MLPSNIIRDVSADLNDQEPGYEYARWPYLQLQTYLQEALDYASLAVKNLFIERVVVQLKVGDVWQDACECEDIVRILGETNADGSRILRRLRRTEDNESLLWQGFDSNKCSYGKSYAMESYTINATDGESFKVYPPIPATEKKPRYVLLECFTAPDAAAGDNVPHDLCGAVKQWMLFRALMIDSENNQTVAEIAIRHRDTFYKLVEDIRTLKLLEVRRDAGSAVRPAQERSSD